MKKILIVTQNGGSFSDLAKGLTAEKTCEIIWADSIETARSVARSQVDLIIIDEIVDGHSHLDIAKDMIRINALAQLVLVSTLSSDEFHDAAEGLGVLAHLPPQPHEKEAAALLNALSAVSSPSPDA